jgi:hypothetical protein
MITLDTASKKRLLKKVKEKNVLLKKVKENKFLL